MNFSSSMNTEGLQLHDSSDYKKQIILLSIKLQLFIIRMLQTFVGTLKERWLRNTWDETTTKDLRKENRRASAHIPHSIILLNFYLKNERKLNYLENKRVKKVVREHQHFSRICIWEPLENRLISLEWILMAFINP